MLKHNYGESNKQIFKNCQSRNSKKWKHSQFVQKNRNISILGRTNKVLKNVGRESRNIFIRERKNKVLRNFGRESRNISIWDWTNEVLKNISQEIPESRNISKVGWESRNNVEHFFVGSRKSKHTKIWLKSWDIPIFGQESRDINRAPRAGLLL